MTQTAAMDSSPMQRLVDIHMTAENQGDMAGYGGGCQLLRSEWSVVVGGVL
jgi:hypothetical protein